MKDSTLNDMFPKKLDAVAFKKWWKAGGGEIYGRIDAMRAFKAGIDYVRKNN